MQKLGRTESNWVYTGFSGTPVTRSGLGLGYELWTQIQTGLGSGSCGSLVVHFQNLGFDNGKLLHNGVRSDAEDTDDIPWGH